MEDGGWRIEDGDRERLFIRPPPRSSIFHPLLSFLILPPRRPVARTRAHRSSRRPSLDFYRSPFAIVSLITGVITYQVLRAQIRCHLLVHSAQIRQRADRIHPSAGALSQASHLAARDLIKTCVYLAPHQRRHDLARSEAVHRLRVVL